MQKSRLLEWVNYTNSIISLHSGSKRALDKQTRNDPFIKSVSRVLQWNCIAKRGALDAMEGCG